MARRVGRVAGYLANFKSFNVTYGSFAAAIILLVWLWLTEGLSEQEPLNLPMGR